jgi:hypothetical protein
MGALLNEGFALNAPTRPPSDQEPLLSNQQAQELGDQGRLRVAFDLQRAVELEQHPPTALRLGGEEVRSCTHACARLYRRDEADLLQSIVEPGRGVRRDYAELRHHCGDQRQVKKTVSNRPAEWAFAPRALDIDVDPLPIASAGCEPVDPALADRDPLGRPDLAANELRRCRHEVLSDFHDFRLWQPAQILAQDLAHI